MHNEQVTLAVNAICVSVGFFCWATIIAAPLQMAGVI